MIWFEEACNISTKLAELVIFQQNLQVALSIEIKFNKPQYVLSLNKNLNTVDYRLKHQSYSLLAFLYFPRNFSYKQIN